MTITYGNGTFTCPSAGDPNSEDSYFWDGAEQYNAVCDPDGLVQITTDGASYIYIQEWFWCPSVPQ